MWGNDQYGDCVTAEEAFAKACHNPEVFIAAATVVAWASKHGYLNGANLTPVMDSMAKGGFAIGSQLYNDGPYTAVDYSNETTLQSAIVQGTVKIGMASGALPQGAGNEQGWYAIKASPNSDEDHCTAFTGFGPAPYLFQQLGVQMPSGVSFPAMMYLFYTWSTIGLVSHEWVMGCVGETWVRTPTTIGVPPLPDPTPPLPPVPPAPTPTPGDVSITLTTEQIQSVISQSGQGLDPAMTLAQLVVLVEQMLGFTPISAKMSPGELLEALQRVLPGRAASEPSRGLEARMDLQDRALSAMIQLMSKK